MIADPAASDRWAERLRAFGPTGIIAIVAILLAGNIGPGGLPVIPAGGLLVLLWAHWSHTPWAELGFARPRSWVATVLIGVAFGITLKLAMKAIVMPLLGADPINRAYGSLVGNDALLPAAVWAMLVAGFGEETVFRGFLFERLRKLLADGVGARIGIVLLTSALFGAVHYPGQELAGVQQGVIVGLAFGTVFTLTRQIWMLIIAHAAFDLTALAIIYHDLEADVAHLFFD